MANSYEPISTIPWGKQKTLQRKYFYFYSNNYDKSFPWRSAHLLDRSDDRAFGLAFVCARVREREWERWRRCRLDGYYSSTRTCPKRLGSTRKGWTSPSTFALSAGPNSNLVLSNSASCNVLSKILFILYALHALLLFDKLPTKLRYIIISPLLFQVWFEISNG